MSHIHWVARQNKLEIPNDEEDVNIREIHKCDGQAHDPDTMVAPLTPKRTRKAEALAKVPPTIASRREEDVALKKWPSVVYYESIKARAKDKTIFIPPFPSGSTEVQKPVTVSFFFCFLFRLPSEAQSIENS
jgi:hypothetical protein